jgi:hypothetical protein
VAARYRILSEATAQARNAEGEITEAQVLSALPMTAEQALAEVKVSGRDFLVFTNRESRAVNTAYRRFDGFWGLIRPQLDRVNGDGTIPFQFEVYAQDEDGESSGTFRRIRRKVVEALPMELEDALSEVERSSNEFWVFTDSERQQVNVVYQLPKGEYGLVEAFATLEG